MKKFNMNKLMLDRVVRKLISVWKIIFEVEDIDIQDDFFMLGGNSLKAVQIIQQVNENFKVDLNVRDLFDFPTIDKLSCRIQSCIGNHLVDSRCFTASLNRGYLPLTAIQQQIYFLCQQTKEAGTAYRVPILFEICGKLDIPALEKSIKYILKKNSIYKLLVRQELSQIYQYMSDTPIDEKFQLETVIPSTKNKIKKQLAYEYKREIALNAPPLFTAKLFLLKENHYFLLVMQHHLITDAWSMALFSESLHHYYPLFLSQKKLLNELNEGNYFDFVNQQKIYLKSNQYEADKKFWLKNLSGFLNITFPSDYRRPSKKSFKGDRQSFLLKSDFIRKLKGFNARYNTTPFMVFAASISILLCRYNAKFEASIGFPFSQRTDSRFKETFGLFLNTLVLRSQLKEDDEFLTFVMRVKNNCLEAYAHGEYPFEHLVRELKVARSLNKNPCFQVMLVWQDRFNLLPFRLGDAECLPQTPNTKTSKFDLTIECFEVEDGIRMTLEYDTELYCSETILRLSQHIKATLLCLLNHPKQKIATFELINHQESMRFITHPPKYTTLPKIHHYFESQAALIPKKIALCTKDSELTYEELNCQANQLAHYLKKHFSELMTLPMEKRVIGVCFPRSLNLLIALLGVLKVGAAYVPIDPDWPLKRVHFVLDNANCHLLITEKAITESMSFSKIPCLIMNEHVSRFTEMPLTNPVASSNPQDWCYIIYTSGTTGLPKGVPQTHHNVVRLFEACNQRFDFRQTDVWVLFHSVAFDFSVWEMWGAWRYGGTLLVPSFEQSRDPALFYQLVKSQEVTVLNQTPSAFQSFMSEDFQHETSSLSLRYIIFGGESLDIRNLSKWWDVHPESSPQLVNMYGTTETTVHATFKALLPQDLCYRAVSNIGEPLADQCAVIVDTTMQPVPIGVVGELLLSGGGLSPCYLGLDGLTQEKFIPLSTIFPTLDKTFQSERAYRTGDLVRRLSDGSLEYLGRIDRQFKLHGFRIEAGEIEQRLNQHSAIDNSFVKRIEKDDKVYLVAYYTLVRKIPCDLKPDFLAEKQFSVELRSYLLPILPAYMIPHHFVQLERFPLTTNMKINSAALPVPKNFLQKEWEKEDLQESDQLTKAQRLLLTILRDLLKKPNIKLDDNFFSLGGDSMLSVILVNVARKKRFSFSVSDVFQAQTVRQLATYYCSFPLSESRARENFSFFDKSKQKHFSVEKIDAIYPLTKLQLGMIYHSSRDAEHGIYLDVFAYRIKLDYKQKYFKDAIDLLIEKNPVLRTAYLLDDFDEPAQVVLKSVDPLLEIEDYRHLSPETQKAGIIAWNDKQKRTPFEYTKAPLFRIKLFLLDEKEIMLGIAFHHSILDGWSVAVLVTSLLKINASLRKNQSQSIAIDWNFRDYVAHERNRGISEEAKLFWQQELKNFQKSDFPKTPPETLSKNRFHKVVQRISHVKMEALLELAKLHAVSLDAVMLAIYLKSLSLFTGQLDVTCGLVFNGRPAFPHIEKTLGLFLNTLPFCFSLLDIGCQTWETLIQAVFQKKKTIYPYRHYPLSQIITDKGSGQLFENIFYFTDFHVYQEISDEAGKIYSQTVNEQTDFSWAIHCGALLGEKDWGLTIYYDSHRYEDAFVKQWLNCYLNLLEQVRVNPKSTHNYYVFNNFERQCLQRWNDTVCPFDEKSVHRLVEETAIRFPNKIALIGEDGEYSYRMLSRLSDYLAKCLLSYCRSDSNFLIGLCVERSAVTVIAILAIFKAGGVYVPLDPNYPKPRIETILINSKSSLLITEQRILEKLNFSPKIPTLFLSEPINQGNIEGGFVKNSLPQVNLTDLAYVIHTSGSTGVPKGVMVSHCSLSNLLLAIANEVKANDKEKLLALTDFTFDISLLEIFLPLTKGGCSVIAPQSASKDPKWIQEALKRYKINFFQATPSTWDLLFEHHVFGTDLTGKQSIKVLCGGEALSINLAKKLLSLTPLAWNVYGPTETTIWSTIYRLNVNAIHKTPPIGRALANTQLYVLDAQQRSLPIGAVGHLYIGGMGLANGYLGQDDLTRKFFIRDKKELPSNILYDTGDLVRWLPEGVLSYQGRCDDQVKVRGFRIEPLEIESVLCQHEQIKASAVLVKSFNDENTSLVAFIVKRSVENDLSIKMVRHWLLHWLPAYFLPDHYIFLDKLPLTAHKKLDRKKLLEMAVANGNVSSKRLLTVNNNLNNQALEASPKAKKLISIWKSVLHLDSILPDDDFFELGGQSILALRLVSKINQVFSTNLSIKEFIEHSVFQNLLSYLVKMPVVSSSKITQAFVQYRGKNIPDPIVVLKREGTKPPLFLVHPVGGNVFYYLPFVKQLANDRPVYAIQDPGLLSRDPLFSSLVDMAEFYISAIKQYQKSQPYYLAGSSFGANAVVEMTRQLLGNREETAFVGLIDGWPRYPDEANKNKDWFCQNLLKQLRKMYNFFSAGDVPELFLELHWHRQQLLVNHCLPDLSNVELTLFKAKELMPVLRPLESPYNNWDTACNSAPRVIEVPGDHFTLHFPPNHFALARAFTFALKNATMVAHL